MLLAQTSPHCQSHLPRRTRIALASVKAFCLPHCQGRSRLLPVICYKRTLRSVEWRWDNQDFQWRRKSDLGATEMRFFNAVLSMDLGNKCSTCKPADNHGAALTNSFNQVSLNTAKASAGGPLFGRLDFEETEEKQREEAERLRRRKISEAKKGRAPWNKGRKGEYKTRDEGSTPHLKEVVEPISQEEKENLRRQRISKANRGKEPWNKGGKHSLETKHRIREGVIERMKDPTIREKLRLQAQAVKLSPEVKLKIKTGLIKVWNEKRRIKARQERFLKGWLEMVAETARIGCEGDVVYEWDSYSTIKRKLQLASQTPVEKQKKSVPNANHSMEHRLRISAAIKAKWSDPNYRISVQKGIQEFKMNRGPLYNPLVTKPKPNSSKNNSKPIDSYTTTYPKTNNWPIKREHASVGDTTGSKSPLKEGLLEPVVIKQELLEPVVMKPNLELSPYKDPEVNKKFEKLMSMRVRRMHAEAQKQKDITERARALIIQAGEAAKALEAAAVKDKNALAPLLETRRLLAEAVSSLESMNWKKTNLESIKGRSSLHAHVLSLANASSEPKGKGEIHLEQGSKRLSESTSVERSSLHTYFELNER